MRATGQEQPGRQTSAKYGISTIMQAARQTKYGTLVISIISMKAAILTISAVYSQWQPGRL